jgi:phosphotransferase family enzyme
MQPLSPALPAPRRVLLGPADVADDELAAFAAASLGVRHATVLTSSARVFPYDRPAITTAGRYLVTGTARTGTGQVRAFALFVKVICAYQRSPLRFAIPAHLRAQAAALIPWHTEADLYRSDLRDRLPAGLAIPRAVAVRDLDADSAALWLEQVPARRVIWDAGRHARAAYLLGRLAASRAVAPLATAVHGARTPRLYADAWLAHVVLPALTRNDIWSQPLVRDTFDARLRDRLLTAADTLPALLDELDDAPAATAHGDACTANLLLAGDRDAQVMVDLGFCGQAPLGTDLGQLIAGEVQTGQRHPADLPALEAACLPAYLAGVQAEGGTARLAHVRRTHAALLTIFSALPSVPIEHLDDEPTPRLRQLFRGRAALARFALDLLDDTRPRGIRRAAPTQPPAATLPSPQEDTVTYAVTIDVHAPAAAYQALHAQLLQRTAGQVDGLLVHLARPTADGFQVLEVWDTKASYDHFNATVIAPLAAQAGLAQAAGTSTGDGATTGPPVPAMSVTQIDISGLVIPRGPVAF